MLFVKSFYLVLCLNFFQTNTTISQDSLQNVSYECLDKKLREYYYTNTEKSKFYASILLNKAKIHNDSLKVTQAYYYLSDFNNYETSLKYIDSALSFNKNKYKNGYHTLLYFNQGNLHFNQGKYKQAIDSYILARDYFNKKYGKYLLFSIEYNLGLVQIFVGDYDNAKKTFERNYKYIVKNKLQEKYKIDYLKYLDAIGNVYWYKGNIDSAKYFNTTILKKAKLYKQPYYLNKAKISQGILNYNEGNYQKSIDSITKYLPYLNKNNDSLDIAIAHLFKGKGYKALNDLEKALWQFKKVDTIIQRDKNYIPLIRENYQLLYNYYKQKGELKNQLLYLERLINFDSILNNNNKYLKNTLFAKYNTPKLIEEKERIIKKLQIEKISKSKTITFLVILTLIAFVFAFYYYRRKKSLQERFDRLMNINDLILNKKPEPSIAKALEISPEIVQDILKKMKQFENEKEFLNNTVTLHSTAKKIGTNSAYLSKIINLYKHKNFSVYVADLRISYVIKALKEQPKLRGYTIEAIAFEIGFKNVQSFRVAFYKQTKLHPSYFLKQLKEHEKVA